MSRWPVGGGSSPDKSPGAEAGPAPDVRPPTPDSIDPFAFARRATTTLHLSERCIVGSEQPPRVVVRLAAAGGLVQAAADLASPFLKDTPVEGLLVPVKDAPTFAGLRRELAAVELPVGFLVLELHDSIAPGALEGFLASSRGRLVLCRSFGAGDAAALTVFAGLVRRHGHFLAIDVAPDELPPLAAPLRTLGDDRLVFTFSGIRTPVSGSSHSLGAYRRLAGDLRRLGSRAPLWIRNTAGTAVQGDNSFLGRLLEASFLTGGLLCDGLGDLVSIETEADPARAARLAYNVLQGAGARISKTEFVACPSCGRTLFDLQTTTQRIRDKTGHLKGVKIAIMGCIVNGPGEMADADFGYVGGAPGKINLYAGKNCVQYNIPQAEADDRLIALIKEHGKWEDREPALAQ